MNKAAEKVKLIFAISDLQRAQSYRWFLGVKGAIFPDGGRALGAIRNHPRHFPVLLLVEDDLFEAEGESFRLLIQERKPFFQIMVLKGAGNGVKLTAAPEQARNIIMADPLQNLEVFSLLVRKSMVELANMVRLCGPVAETPE